MSDLTYKEAQKIRERICRNYEACRGCPLADDNNGKGEPCVEMFGFYPNETEEILKKWQAEHPIVTNREKFIEVFGDKFFEIDCPEHVIKRRNIPCCNDDWWNQEYEEH